MTAELMAGAWVAGLALVYGVAWVVRYVHHRSMRRPVYISRKWLSREGWK